MTADLDDIFRREAGRLVPYLVRRLGPRHFDLAEDAVQDAFVQAARHWPTSGVPEDPRAWLLKTAHRKALDRLKRDHTAKRNVHLLSHAAEARLPRFELEPERDLPDEIAVLLLACHPSLPRDAQVALALRTLGGLSTQEVARALLVSADAAAQRIVRAKRGIQRAGSAPISDHDLELRIDAAMDVIYLMFNEGHYATDGADLVRSQMMGDAIYLGGLLASTQATSRPRVHALVALMHFGASRAQARADSLGDLVLFGDQDRSLWDSRHRTAAFRHLDLASTGPEVSRFHVEAGIAALHAGAGDLQSTDWPQILSLYDELMANWPSPVVALNRSVVVLRVHGVNAAEAALAPARSDPSLASYAPAYAVAAELARLRGDRRGAAALIDRALACPISIPQRRFLERGKAELTEEQDSRTTLSL